MVLINLVSPSEELRQGDVLTLTATAEAPYGAKLGVVITADCDLAQSKHYGHVLLCPIIPARIYYEEIWCAKRLENSRAKTLGRLREEFDGFFERGILSSPLSDQALRTICASEDTLRESVAPLALPAGKVDELAHLVLALAKSGSEDGSLLALVASSAHTQRKDPTLVREKLFSDFKSDLAKDAIDVVAIHDDLSGEDVVHVVLLRAPFSVAAQRISFSARARMPSDCIRAGRFAPEIKFLISQKFGTLFSRVGLKREIELDRDAAIELLRDIV